MQALECLLNIRRGLVLVEQLVAPAAGLVQSFGELFEMVPVALQNEKVMLSVRRLCWYPAPPFCCLTTSRSGLC